MGLLVANSSELTLVDLIQVKGISRRTCRIFVKGKEGPGFIFLHEGEVIYSSYAGFKGEPAACALLCEEEVGYRVTSEVETPPPNMQIGYQHLIMEAMRLLDEKNGTRALSQSAPSSPTPNEIEIDFEWDMEETISAPLSMSKSRHKSRLFAFSAAVVGALLLGATMLFPLPKPEANATSSAATRERQEFLGAANAFLPAGGIANENELDDEIHGIEANILSKPEDSLPFLINGAPPKSPLPGIALQPIIVCRLLIDTRGKVARGQILQHRIEVEPFEKSALAAVKHYRFKPGTAKGVPVAVWIHWPVDFL